MSAFLSILYYISFALYVYTIAVAVSVILLENRNPVKSLAWIVVLILLPVLGLVLYIFLGQDFRRSKIFSRQGLKKNYVKPEYALGLKDLVTSDIPKHIQKTIRLLYKSAASPAYIDTKVDVLIGAEESFNSFFEDIKAAKDHIHIEFYIIEDDNIGNELRRLLIRKAQERVRVRVIYDYLGGHKLSQSFLTSLRNAGVYIQPFLPVGPRLGFSKVNYRNHRKLIIIDGRIGYTGGVNIADRYIVGNRLGLWRDTLVRLEGPAVHGMQDAFLTDWFFVDNKMITDERYYPDMKRYHFNNIIQTVVSGPDTDRESILQGLVTIFSNARNYIYIHTPYFLPPESILTALEIAAMSGVDVRIMVPEKSDTPLVAAASRSYMQGAMEGGIRVFSYQNNFLHSKAITVDGEIGIVGTANMDIRSFEQNFEIGAFIYDPQVASILYDAFKQDMLSCVEIDLQTWGSRPKHIRFIESIARLFSPLL